MLLLAMSSKVILIPKRPNNWTNSSLLDNFNTSNKDYTSIYMAA